MKQITIFQQRLFFLFLVFTLSLSCGSISRQYPEKKFFLFEVKKEENTNRGLSKGSSLKVRRFSISPRFDSKEFVYRKSDVVYESDFYNLFFISPATNLKEEMVSYLIQKQVFDWDASSQSKVEPTHFLEANVHELYGDFRGREPKAVLRLEILLYTEKNGGTQILSKKVYSREILISKTDPEALAQGWNLGFSEILAEISSDWKDKVSQ